MSAPLDFSSIGANKPTPPAPQKKSLKRRMPGRKPKVWIAAFVLLALVAGWVAFARSDTTPDRADKLALYCEAATEFDRLVPVAAPGTDAMDTSAAAMSRLVRTIGDTLSQITANAPAEIRSDVVATVAALEDAARGKSGAVRSPSFQERRQRVTVVGEAMCLGGSTDAGS